MKIEKKQRDILIRHMNRIDDLMEYQYLAMTRNELRDKIVSILDECALDLVENIQKNKS